MLSPRKTAFVQAYLSNGGNATAAAIAAGYSAHTAKQQGSRLLTAVDVKAALAIPAKKAADKLEITAERVLQVFAVAAFVDPRDFVDENGAPKALKDLTEHQARALHTVEIEEETEKHGRIHKIKFRNATEGARELARTMGMYEADNKQQRDSFTALVRRAAEIRRAKKK